MASSVSSERAFSSAGITLTKQRNHLKGDIVEALQGLKAMINHDVLFRDPFPTSELEKEIESAEKEQEHGQTEKGVDREMEIEVGASTLQSRLD